MAALYDMKGCNILVGDYRLISKQFMATHKAGARLTYAVDSSDNVAVVFWSLGKFPNVCRYF